LVGFNNLLLECLLSVTGRSIPVTPCPIATAMHPKHLTQALHRMALFKSLDYRELLRESDIKRAVAFFKISFSSSARRSRRFSSCISRWSVVRASPLGGLPARSERSLLTQYSMVHLPTPMASQAAFTVSPWSTTSWAASNRNSGLKFLVFAIVFT